MVALLCDDNLYLPNKQQTLDHRKSETSNYMRILQNKMLIAMKGVLIFHHLASGTVRFVCSYEPGTSVHVYSHQHRALLGGFCLQVFCQAGSPQW